MKESPESPGNGRLSMDRNLHRILGIEDSGTHSSRFGLFRISTSDRTLLAKLEDLAVGMAGLFSKNRAIFQLTMMKETLLDNSDMIYPTIEP
jgi:hypothetical protein